MNPSDNHWTMVHFVAGIYEVWLEPLDKAPIRELQPDEMERVRSAG